MGDEEVFRTENNCLKTAERILHHFYPKPITAELAQRATSSVKFRDVTLILELILPLDADFSKNRPC